MSDVNELDDINMQKYLESDYDLETSKSKSNREIDHLVFCIHGIGQVLGTKYESVNFTHSINVLRNTMKGVLNKMRNTKSWQILTQKSTITLTTEFRSYPSRGDIVLVSILNKNLMLNCPLDCQHYLR